MKRIKYTILAALLLSFSFISQAQSYSSADFVGEWHGEIFNRYDGTRQTSIMLYSNGDYTESSGNLMPTIYPNTQKWEYEASTNRLHFWWLQTVYAGHKTYSHTYYELIRFDQDSVILHYNFWDDPVAHPEVGKLELRNKNAISSVSTIEPVNLQIFPNPAVNASVVNIIIENVGADIDILDMKGDVVFEERLNREYNQIDISKLDKGFYLIRINQNGQLMRRKLVVQ
jgi:hypothetical protein